MHYQYFQQFSRNSLDKLHKIAQPLYNRGMADSRNITLQRRHGPSCAAGHKKGSYTFEADERRRGSKACRCPIYACGTLAGVYRRMPTGRRVWTDAAAVLGPYLVAGRWELEAPPSLPCPAPEDDPPAPSGGGRRLTIDDSIASCFAEHKAVHSAASTVRAYRTLLADFKRQSEALGFRWLDEWKSAHVRAWRNSWTCSIRTTRKKMGYLKSFFELAAEDETIPYNPARIKAHVNRAARAAAQKNPYTDEELQRMLEGCRHTIQSKVVEIRPRGGYTSTDLADFIEISSFTGLRISDVVSFDIERLTPLGEVKLRCLKNGNPVCVWIPEWLRAIIQSRARTVGPRIFGSVPGNTEAECVKWRRRLVTLWKRTGPWTSPATHHRFRHTFVRRLLEQGVSVAIVAELIGDTEQMVRRSYSGWIKSRQEAMTQVLQKAFANAPRYHR